MGWQEPEGNGLDARSYRAILGNPGIAAIILDADGLICEVSSCASAYLDRSPESLVGQHILEVTHPEDASATLESIRRLADGDESSRFAKRYVRADGSLLWADVTATPVRDSGGRLERVIAIVQNPTGGRLAEIALLDAQRNLVQLMNAISEGLLILDYRGHILAVNASATALLGYDARTLKGLPLAELCVQPDGEGAVADLVHDMATGEVSTVTVQLRTADGARIPSELRVTHGTWSGESVLFVVWRDTTDRLRYEAELRASAEQLAAVFEASPGLLVLTDASTGEIINVNSAFERATGVSREGAIGHPAWELGLALAPQTQRPLMEMVRGHSSTPLESAYVTVDGEEREALVSAHSACIGGRPCILIAATDITEFRRAERALRQSEQQYRQVVEASGEAIAIVQGGVFQYLNPRGETALRVRPGGVVGRPVLDIVHAKDRAAVAEYLERWESAREDRTFSFRVVDAIGHVRWIRGSWTMTQWQGAPALLALAQDVTELVEAERAAREATERLRQVIDLIPIPVAARDPDGRYLLLNRASAGFHGSKPEELQGQLLQDIVPVPDYVRSVLEADAEAVRSGGPHLVPGVRIPDALGNDHVFDITRVPITLRDGRTGILAVAVETTEMVRAQSELSAAIAELSRSNADLEQFAYVASHDLKEPLRSVSYSLHLLGSNYPEVREGSAGAYLSEALRGAQRMDRLINDLLAYSRAGRHSAVEPISVEQALGEALGSLASLASETGAQVTWAGLPGEVCFDRSQLGAVLQNLLSNAMRFSGGRPPTIHVWGERRPGEWLIHVRDEGVGIDPHDHDRIFRMFQRAGTHPQANGTGMGLALCARMVESHGGRIWVESELGKGATFTFSVPDRPVSPSDGM